MSRSSLASGLIVALLLMIGCSKYSGPYRICTKSHTYTYPMWVGKVMVMQTGTACDEYTREQFIKVNKIIYRVEEAWKEN